jgi:hypothetical protein
LIKTEKDLKQNDLEMFISGQIKIVKDQPKPYGFYRCESEKFLIEGVASQGKRKLEFSWCRIITKKDKEGEENEQVFQSKEKELTKEE